MLLCIADVLSESDLQSAQAALAAAEFRDGRATAGWSAARVKRNLQAVSGQAGVDELRRTLEARILGHALVALAARPKTLTPLILSRYEAGMAYGAHVDDALMRGMRTDLALTLFLAAPESYEGGELVIESSAGEQAVKLAAGALVLYPATALHRVEPVRRGVRLAAVGWIRSFVRDAARREILFDVDRARRSLFERHGKTAEVDLLHKSTANLLRMWAED
jgi:PKHD-type hydroxylase